MDLFVITYWVCWKKGFEISSLGKMAIDEWWFSHGWTMVGPWLSWVHHSQPWSDKVITMILTIAPSHGLDFDSNWHQLFFLLFFIFTNLSKHICYLFMDKCNESWIVKILNIVLIIFTMNHISNRKDICDILSADWGTYLCWGWKEIEFMTSFGQSWHYSIPWDMA